MKRYSLIIILFILLILVIGGMNSFRIYKNPSNNSDNPSEYEISAEEAKLINNNPKSHSIGSSTPLVTIIEFSDFACPYCKKTFPTIREMSLKYQDQIKIIYRHYPIITEHSVLLAQAAECAGEQRKFWAMHDSLFLNQGIATEAELKELARQIGLNGTEFDYCINNQKYLEKITADFEAGQALEITGTPTWFINNIKVAGDIPSDIFYEIVDSLIIQNNK
jgi:protein-disulfide isomerase